jgi:hypothetical protein
MKKIICIIFLIIIGIDLFAERPRFSTTRKKKEDWTIGTGGCACCCGSSLLVIPGMIVHTPYRMGIEGSLWWGFSEFLEESFWNIQLIYDVVQIKSPKRVFKNITKLHIYTGMGIGEDNVREIIPKSEIDIFRETENITEIQGIIVSLGTDIVIKFPGCLTYRKRSLIIGAKTLFLSPWYDRRYKKVTENGKILEEKETIREDLLFKTLHCIPLILYIYFQF